MSLLKTLLLPLVFVIILAWRELSLQPDGMFHVFFFPVGQGDATLLITPTGKHVLIDGGRDLSTLEYLGTTLPFFNTTIDLLVLTHPDNDHLSSLPQLLRRYAVSGVLLTGVQHDLGKYKDLLNQISEKDIPVLLPDPKKDLDLGGGVLLDIVWPSQNLFGKETHNNNSSVVLRVLFETGAILLTGDIEKEAESAILASGADIRADILKVPHHGSKTSSSDEFISAVDPRIAIVSAGAKNPYGHPNPGIMERYAQHGIIIRETSKEGIIEIIWGK